MANFWHPKKIFELNSSQNDNDLVDALKRLRRVLHDLEIKMTALENKIYYGFFSVEDILKDIQCLKLNEIVKRHSLLLEIADMLTITVKKIFLVNARQAQEGLSMVSNAVETMDNFIYGYYFDGKSEVEAMIKARSVIVKWLTNIES